MERPVRVLVCALAAAVAAAPLTAAVYKIQLTNGNSFETRYEPEDASYDSGKVVFLDETGLLITIAKSDIVSIQSDFEAKGYGRMINTTTMELGWAPNDVAEGGGEGAPADPFAQVQQAIQGQQQSTTFNQFVEPDATQGMPGNWVGGSFSSPQPVVVPVQIQAPAPAPSAPAGGGDVPPPSDGGGQ
jgi:hypothetical protein